MSEKSTRNALVYVAESRMVRNRSAFRPQMQIKSSKSGPPPVQFEGSSPQKGDSGLNANVTAFNNDATQDSNEAEQDAYWSNYYGAASMAAAMADEETLAALYGNLAALRYP